MTENFGEKKIASYHPSLRGPDRIGPITSAVGMDTTRQLRQREPSNEKVSEGGTRDDHPEGEG